MGVSYKDLDVAFTGIRDLHEDSFLTVRDATIRVMADGPRSLSFGGADGSDTVSLLAAIYFAPIQPPPLITIVVPGYVYEQPAKAYEAIRRAVAHGAEFHEMCLDVSKPQSYWARNALLIRPVAAVVGFTDGRKTGGTAGTLEMARAADKIVEEIRVRGSKNHG